MENFKLPKNEQEEKHMEIYGGRAGFNSVSFTGERYYAVSEIKNNEITTYIKPKKEGGKITDIISRVPFVRSYSLFIELILERWMFMAFNKCTFWQSGYAAHPA
jgi:hypothetical protein